MGKGHMHAECGGLQVYVTSRLHCVGHQSAAAARAPSPLSS